MSQTLCQCASLPQHPAAVGFLDEEKTHRGKTVGWEEGSECISFPPLSSASTLSRGVMSYLRPGAVSGSGHGERGALSLSLSLFLLLSLAWLDSREDSGVRSSGLCSHGSRRARARVGDGQRPRESKRSRELQPFSHVFDMGVVPTGVKDGRAE